MNKNKTDLWLEKYRPKNFKNYIGNKDDIENIIKWIENYDTRKEKFLLLYGAPGVGKTTLAHLILNKYNYELIEINTSHYRSKKMIKERISILSGGVSVVSNSSTLKRKLIKKTDIKYKKIGLLMDEIDGISINSESSGIQELMDIIIGKNKKRKNNKFPIICTCNSIKNKKIQILLKHSLVIKIVNPIKEELTLLCEKIIQKENINIKSDLINIIINNSYDYRELINNLYQIHIYSNHNELNQSIIYNIINCDNKNHNDKNDNDKNDNDKNHNDKNDNDKNDNNTDEIYNLRANKKLVNINTIYSKLKYIIDNDISLNEIKYTINADNTILFMNLFSNYLKILKNYKLSKKDNYKIINLYLNNYVIGDYYNKIIYTKQLWEFQEYINNISLLSNILLLKNNINFLDKNNKKKPINKSYQLEYHSSFNKVLQDSYLSRNKRESINKTIFINDIQSIYYINNIISNNFKIHTKKINKHTLYEKTTKINKKIDDYLSN